MEAERYEGPARPPARARTSSSSSSSSSDGSADRRRAKKEKKRKKEDRKKEKKERKRRKKEKKEDRKRKRDAAQDLEEADATQLEAFRAAVQGPKRAAAAAPSAAGGAPVSLALGGTAEERASALGLPAGLVRTTVRNESISDRGSKSLFGYGGSANPAQQARVARERAAQRALAKARSVLAARAGDAAADAADASPKASSLTARFDSGFVMRTGHR